MIFEPERETMGRDDLEQLQLERLQSTLFRVFRHVPFYRKTFLGLGFDPESVTSLTDVRKLPFTTKKDIRDNYPYGLFAVPLREVVRLQTSSGTTGKPVVVGYTKNDIRKWTSLVARMLTMGGVTRDDVVQIALGYGLFTGGFGFHYGAEHIGASVIPSSTGGARRQVTIMQDYRTTTLVSTPSYALHIAETLEEMGISPGALSLRYGLFGAEAWSEETRRLIEERLSIQATDNYGISEVMGPGIAGECLEKNGLHIQEDHFLAEIIDPISGAPCGVGETGELVLTTLTKEAFPVIRFRTGDLTCFLPDECPCGRTFRRMGRIAGRSDDMIIVRGVNVFPGRIESVLARIEGVKPLFKVVLDREGALDHAVLQVAVSEEVLSDRIGEAEHLVRTIQREMSSELGVTFEVKLVEPKHLRTEGEKQILVEDRRKL